MRSGRAAGLAHAPPAVSLLLGLRKAIATVDSDIAGIAYSSTTRPGLDVASGWLVVLAGFVKLAHVHLLSSRGFHGCAWGNRRIYMVLKHDKSTTYGVTGAHNAHMFEGGL